MTEYQPDPWRWLFVILPQLVAQDMGRTAASLHLQRHSDLGLLHMPMYLCQVPSNFYFPYSTYSVKTWPIGRPYFEIPFQPLDRLAATYWIDGMGPGHFEVVNPSHRDWKLSWINPEGEFVHEKSYLEVVRRAAALQTYLLNSVRYVYDESKSMQDGMKTSKPTRSTFDARVASFESTTTYITWYLEVLNGFIDRFLEHAKSGDAEKRKQSLIAGLTINRLAVDAILTMSTDAPYVRKWQFFGFLDGLVALKNDVSGAYMRAKMSPPALDAKEATRILGESFFSTQLLPCISQIPVEPMRVAVQNLTKDVYAQISQLGAALPREEDDQDAGPKLLRAYRNSRHGYMLNSTEREKLLLHDGRVPNDLPDLIIALWHYLLLSYPFEEEYSTRST